MTAYRNPEHYPDPTAGAGVWKASNPQSAAKQARAPWEGYKTPSVVIWDMKNIFLNAQRTKAAIVKNLQMVTATFPADNAQLVKTANEAARALQAYVDALQKRLEDVGGK